MELCRVERPTQHVRLLQALTLEPHRRVGVMRVAGLCTRLGRAQPVDAALVLVDCHSRVLLPAHMPVDGYEGSWVLGGVVVVTGVRGGGG